MRAGGSLLEVVDGGTVEALAEGFLASQVEVLHGLLGVAGVLPVVGQEAVVPALLEVAGGLAVELAPLRLEEQAIGHLAGEVVAEAQLRGGLLDDELALLQAAGVRGHVFGQRVQLAQADQ